ncbi:class C sortase [Microbacterium sp. 179-B 1A2 NHS]|uniref:class C sortase n=1 Tax=Microbacterium sp. 179-B 1A2 NHS TaxID=3142383 RepID=UPI0039A35E59
MTPAPPSDAAAGAASSRRQRRRARRWRAPVVPLIIAVVCLLGAALLLYPSAASWFSQVEQSSRIDDLTYEITDLGAETLAELLAEARAYNDELTGGGAALAANERLPLAVDPDPDAGLEYEKTLRADAEGLMARIKIPAIDVDLPVYHGTGEDVLEHGVGHLKGTALPVGGASTHAVLTAHRGLATSELFTHLDQVAEDDTFTIEVFGEVLTYRVVGTKVVEPDETESLLPQVDRDLVTLVTCTPLGVNSHRILVTGERVIPTPSEDLDNAGKTPDVPGFAWWIVIGSAVIAILVLYVWLSGRPPRPPRTRGL